tara:strand:+ start:342 stop:671 length:330 start_codon:yes stop_codon:yes gene_type:complete
LGKPNLLSTANFPIFIQQIIEGLRGIKMRVYTLVLLLFSITCFASSSAIAENANSLSEDSDSVHITGFVVLGLALIGWTFILILLVNAILKIFKKAKNHSVAGLPVKCK